MNIALYIITPLMGLLLITYFLLRRFVLNRLPNNYPTPENIAATQGKKVVVCAGDSNTQGNMGEIWVVRVEKNFPQYAFLNAGINGDLTYTLMARWEDVIAAKPDFVTILIGTNDVNATMGAKKEKRYRQMKKVFTMPTYKDFRENLIAMIEALKEQTSAHIAIMSLPLIGEDLAHAVNLKADKYSEAIKGIADLHKIDYLPLREKQKAYLEKQPSKPKYTFEDTDKLIYYAVVLRYLLFQSFDKIARIMGFQLLTDNLHQNGTSAQMIADLVQEFIQKYEEKPPFTLPFTPPFTQISTD